MRRSERGGPLRGLGAALPPVRSLAPGRAGRFVAERWHWGATVLFFASGAGHHAAGAPHRRRHRGAGRPAGRRRGGLLNATFGNATELIIAIVALLTSQYDLVKASLVGSILGNILAVLGLAFLAGGLGRERQRFDRTARGRRRDAARPRRHGAARPTVLVATSRVPPPTWKA